MATTADQKIAFRPAKLKMAGDVTSSGDKKKYSWNLKKFIERTPCARESFLYGMAGGIIVGAGYFLKSMYVLRSCRYAVGSFALISIGSWEMCRYMRYKEEEAIKETIDIINKHRQQNEDQEGNE